MSKLTLSVDPIISERAKRYARRKGLSVSGMVETYLATVTAGSPDEARDTPVLRALRGSLKKGSVEDYRKHLVSKHR